MRDKSAERMDMLQQEHRDLDARVARLSRRAHLTPEEETELRELKKLKLAKRDELSKLRVGNA